MQNQYYITLPPVAKETKRPLWSVVIPTYNCAHYLKETLQSVLAQDPGEDQMEIIVIDDHSTQDDPEAVVKEIGNGRVQFIRQDQNVGKVRNYETGLQATKGYFIHQLHGDDMVRPGFYDTMKTLLGQYPEAGAAFCRSIYIDGQGRWTGMTGMIQDLNGIVPDMLKKIYTEQYIQTPSIVVKRYVYENIGAFDRRLNCIEDWEMWIRLANYYPIATTNLVLAKYRTHGQNTTQISFKDGSAISEQQLICKIVDNYIQPGVRKECYKLRSRKQAAWLLNYKNSANNFSLLQKIKFSRYILKKDFSFRTIYRLLS
jgi:glycosyltransferase involved in cell wall biosynthesis